MDNEQHKYYMSLALEQAKLAFENGETPTGCVIIRTNRDVVVPTSRIIARARNSVESLRDPTAHAEMIAITQAASAVGDWRLTDTILYVTKEPCAMCAGAIVLARVPTVVFGAPDPRRGGVSKLNILNHPDLVHRCTVIGRCLEDPCAELLKTFFRRCRSGDRPGKPRPDAEEPQG